MSIDWTNPKTKVSKYFTVRESLWLPQWNRLATETELTEITKSNLIQLCTKMDEIREVFGASIVVHCCFRPDLYNKQVGGALNSAHKFGMAIDFHINDYGCDEAREKINKLGLLASLKLRMEDLPGSSWVHIDTRKPSSEAARFFKP